MILCRLAQHRRNGVLLIVPDTPTRYVCREIFLYNVVRIVIMCIIRNASAPISRHNNIAMIHLCRWPKCRKRQPAHGCGSRRASWECRGDVEIKATAFGTSIMCCTESAHFYRARRLSAARAHRIESCIKQRCRTQNHPSSSCIAYAYKGDENRRPRALSAQLRSGMKARHSATRLAATSSPSKIA